MGSHKGGSFAVALCMQGLKEGKSLKAHSKEHVKILI